MSRYRPTVSEEGFFSNVGKFLSDVGSSVSRNLAIGTIAFDSYSRPEVLGVPAKDYTQLISKLKKVIDSEQPWDATIVTNHYEYINTNQIDPTTNSPVRKSVRLTSVVVLIGTGRNVIVRLPGYQGGGNMASARVARLLIEDLNLFRVE